MKLDSFERVAKATQKQLLRYLPKVLKSKGYKDIISTKDYIYAPGELPVLLIAHLDTVFFDPPEQIFFDQKYQVYWSPEGLGADDRAGVWGVLQLLDKKPHVIFCTEEEIGGKGARLAAEQLPPPPVKFMIELDRGGKEDCVFYDCETAKFMEYIEGFGFKTDIGSYSDISFLMEEWKICGVNLSCGYYNAHQKTEFFSIHYLNQTLEKVRKIFDNLPEDEFEYEGFYLRKKKEKKDKQSWVKNLFQCKWCGKWKSINVLYSEQMEMCMACAQEMELPGKKEVDENVGM